MTSRIAGLIILGSLVQPALPHASAQGDRFDAAQLLDAASETPPFRFSSAMQDTRPLLPAEPLAPTQPDLGNRQARDLIGPRTLGSTFQGRARRELLARRAPPMIGDFFGGGTGTTASLTTESITQTFTPQPMDGFVPLQPDGSGPGLRTVGSPGSYVLPDGTSIPIVSRVLVGDVGEINAAFQQNALAPLPIFEDPMLTAALAEANSAVFGEGVTQFVQAVVEDGFHVEPTTGRDIFLVPDTFADTFSTRDVYMFSQMIQVEIPSPGLAGGAVVGRMKIAENSSPLPRDRFFINYSYFDNVPMIAGGVNVNRFSPGVEKTFFDGRTSIEVRAPFASTLDTDIMADGTTNTSEVVFGNLTFNLKGLLYSNESVAFSTGLGVTAPTANDLRVISASGNTLLNVDNESVHLMPFVGGLYAPDDRLFAQAMMQVDFDTNGNPISVDLTGKGLQEVGRINDVTYLYADIGAGYWLFRRDGGTQLRGAAAIAELHYNRSLTDEDFVQAGPLQLGQFKGHIELINLVLGTTLEIGDDKLLTLGYSTPVAGGNDKQFDGELRVLFVHNFGPSSRQSRAF